MARRRASGFLAAIIISVVSFFVVFLFFPEVSDKYFGVSLKHGDASVEKFKEDAKETAGEALNTVVDKTADAVAEKVSDAVENSVKTTKKSVSDFIK